MKLARQPIAVLTILVCLVVATTSLPGGLRAQSSSGPVYAGIHLLDEADAKRARAILADRGCPCGCGRYLPKSLKQPVCFGCTVGKTEIARTIEGFISGRAPIDLLGELNETVLIDVFADYTAPGLPEVWSTATKVAAEYGQHRVVLRTVGRSADAQRAVKIVECARDYGKFLAMRDALIAHEGPWDEDTLIEIAVRHALPEGEFRSRLQTVDIRAQIAKDVQHARGRRLENLPAISVNLIVVEATESAIRAEIKKKIQESDI